MKFLTKRGFMRQSEGNLVVNENHPGTRMGILTRKNVGSFLNSDWCFIKNVILEAFALWFVKAIRFKFRFT